MVRNKNAFTGNNGGNSACQKIKEVWAFGTCKVLTLQCWLNRFGGSWPNLNFYVLVCFGPSVRNLGNFGHNLIPKLNV